MHPYFRTSSESLRSNIRLNLSINPCFIKCGRVSSRWGFYWYIHPSCIEMFKCGDFSRSKIQRRIKEATLRGVLKAYNPAPTHFTRNSVAPIDKPTRTFSGAAVGTGFEHNVVTSDNHTRNERQACKPNETYVSLIAKAMLASKKTKLTREEICEQVRNKT